MQRYSNPDVFLCPTYNVPGITNPKMHISEEGRPDKTPRSYPGLGTSEGLTTHAPSWPPSSSTSCGDNSLSPEPSSPDSDYDRKVLDYDRIFEELINAE